MFFSLDQVLQLLLHYKYLILFPIVVVEGPIVTVIAGLVVATGFMNLFIAYAVIVIGDLAGDAIYYAIGRYGREKFLNRWGKYIGLKPDVIARIETHFEKHGGKTLLFGKLAHGIGAIFLVAAGLVRMPFLKFLGANMVATLLKSLALLLVGFYFGEAVRKANSILEFIGALSISIGIIAILAFLHYYKKKKSDRAYE
ncbi:MAG: DedA family protein [Candidatus Jorgensenbacteria bacterium]|nr:DedA family protein [Candidatus Jorgensenbacteria bacterium]